MKCILKNWYKRGRTEKLKERGKRNKKKNMK